MENENQNKQGYGKRPLWQWILIYIILAVLVYGAVYYFFFSKSYSAPTYQNNNSQTNSTKVKFADTADSKNAYLISTDKYDSSTQKALTGFKVDRKVLSDGTQQITLSAQTPGYQSQSYTVKPGQSLYFIERYSPDDQNGQDKNAGDDTAVLVDENGYGVQ